MQPKLKTRGATRLNLIVSKIIAAMKPAVGENPSAGFYWLLTGQAFKIMTGNSSDKNKLHYNSKEV